MLVALADGVTAHARVIHCALYIQDVTGMPPAPHLPRLCLCLCLCLCLFLFELEHIANETVASACGASFAPLHARIAQAGDFRRI